MRIRRNSIGRSSRRNPLATRKGTHMIYTEQLVYLDGHDDKAQRMHGTEEGFDRLQLALKHAGALQ